MARTPRAGRPVPPITEGAALAAAPLPLPPLAETTDGGNAAPPPVRAFATGE